MPDTRLLAAELLDRGAHTIRTRGWTKRKLRDSKGRVCALGALDVHTHDLDNPGMVEGSLRCIAASAVERVLRIERYHLDIWNDEVATSADDVCFAFELAADRLRANAAAAQRHEAMLRAMRMRVLALNTPEPPPTQPTSDPIEPQRSIAVLKFVGTFS